MQNHPKIQGMRQLTIIRLLFLGMLIFPAFGFWDAHFCGICDIVSSNLFDVRGRLFFQHQDFSHLFFPTAHGVFIVELKNRDGLTPKLGDMISVRRRI